MDENQDNVVEAKGYDFDMDGELDKVELQSLVLSVIFFFLKPGC